MKNKKIIILIIITILLLITSIIAYFYSNEISEKPAAGDNNIVSNVASHLKNESDFFTIQNIINKYYSTFIKNDTASLYNLLDKNFIQEQGITTQNILNKISSDYEVVNFHANDIYYKITNNKKYYFVKGYLTNTRISDDSIEYEKNINFLVITEDNKCAIRPLSNVENLEDYANDYKILDVDLKNGKTYNEININTEQKLIVYLNSFKELLFLDPHKAYNLLSDVTKEKYSGYAEFQNNIENIEEKIFTSIFSYAEQQSNGYVIYKIMNNQQNIIQIKEFNIMNFEITY